MPLDELEWVAENATLGVEQRERAVTDLIDLVGAVDGLLQLQSKSDAAYFIHRAGRELTRVEQAEVHATLLKAYRYQYILSGVQRTRFPEILKGMLSETQFQRVVAALAPLS